MTFFGNIIQIQHDSTELCPGNEFWFYMRCDLDLGDMTSCTSDDWPLKSDLQKCNASTCNLSTL